MNLMTDQLKFKKFRKVIKKFMNLQ